MSSATVLARPRSRVLVAATLAGLVAGVPLGALAGPPPGISVAAGARRIVVVASPASPAPAAAAPAVVASPRPSPPSVPSTPGPDASVPAAPSPPAGHSGPSLPATRTPAPAPAAPAPGAKSAPPPAAAPTTAAVSHVWLIMLGSQGADALFSQPYLSSLKTRGTYVPGYVSVTHGGLAAGQALLAGVAPTQVLREGCPVYADGDCVQPPRTATLADQLTGRGLTWRAYIESLPAPCAHPALGAADSAHDVAPGSPAVTWRDPFVYFHSIVDDAACGSGVVGLDRLAPDLADAAATPAFSYVVPDTCHDGRDAPCAPGVTAGPAAADAWLPGVVEPILASRAYADGGLLAITADEAPGDATGGGGRVGLLLLGPRVAAGATSDAQLNTYGLLATLEELFGLERLGHAGHRGRRVLPAGLVAPSSQDVHPSATTP